MFATTYNRRFPAALCPMLLLLLLAQPHSHLCSDFSSKVNVKIGEVLPLREDHPPAPPPPSQSLQSLYSSQSRPRGLLPPPPPPSHDWNSSSGTFPARPRSYQQHPAGSAANDERSQEFSKVNIRVMGENIDSNTLLSLKPVGRFVNPDRLMRVLRQDFDHDWMSVDQPPPLERFTRNPTGSRHDANLLEQVKKINFTFVDAAGAALHMQPGLLQQLQVWMIRLASCPIDYIWEDLGPLFWPRWIKRGVCLNTRSCSWPAGMHCRPSGTKEIKLLHWSCQPDKNGEQKDQLNAWMQRRHRRRELRKNRHLRAISSGGGFRGDPRNSLPSNYYSASNTAAAYQRHQSSGAQLQQQQHASTNVRSPRQAVDNTMDQYIDEEPEESTSGRRARRIIQRLSLAKDGYFCQWQRHKYVISDQCSCNCP